MKKFLLTIFANFNIDNSERLQRMKDSFNSFNKVKPDQYIINIRGKFKHRAGKFLKQKVGKKLELTYLNSRRGWFHDSRIISKKIISKFVLFWIEDHMLISSPDTLKKCIKEMDSYKVDQLQYSLLHDEMRKTWSIPPTQKVGKYIKIINLNSNNCIKIKNKLKEDFYTISCVHIFKKNFFFKVLFSNKPYLKRWPRHLPFDFEKKSMDKISLDISLAIPHKELFAVIDDDHKNPGYSLISRKKYPNRISRNDLMSLEFNKIKKSESLGINIKIKNLIKKNHFLNNNLIKFIYLIKRIFYTINLFGNKK
jgi:hypothetical protein